MRNSIFLGLISLTLVAGTAGAGDIRTTGQFISENAAGPPMQVNSIQKVLNLNADRLDGMSASEFASAADLAAADSGVEVHWKNITNTPGVEIDQDCALSGGCDTGSDTSGFPVTITEPGSYRLVSNLTTASANTTLISIQASNVTLDLSGFALLGPNSCSGTPVTSCTSPGSGNGISVPSAIGRSGVSIFNGSVAGMGQYGINCGAPCSIARVNIQQSANAGIFGNAHLVEHVTSNRNGSRGLAIEGIARNSVAEGNQQAGMSVLGSIVACRATQNGEDGFVVTGTVVNSIAEDNDSAGFNLQDGAVATGNTARSNDFWGITAFGHVTIEGNSAYNNGDDGIDIAEGVVRGNSSFENAADGLSCSNCFLVDNISGGNDGDGVQFFGSDSVWGRNMLTGNANNVSGVATDLGDNTCDGGAC